MKIIQQWKEQPDKSYRVIAFGSSNTELSWSNNGRHNWVDWLSINLRDSIGHHVSVVNQGIGGETSDHLLARIDRDVLSFNRPSLLSRSGEMTPLLMFPSNDMSITCRKYAH